MSCQVQTSFSFRLAHGIDPDRSSLGLRQPFEDPRSSRAPSRGPWHRRNQVGGQRSRKQRHAWSDREQLRRAAWSIATIQPWARLAACRSAARPARATVRRARPPAWRWRTHLAAYMPHLPTQLLLTRATDCSPQCSADYVGSRLARTGSAPGRQFGPDRECDRCATACAWLRALQCSLRSLLLCPASLL